MIDGKFEGQGTRTVGLQRADYGNYIGISRVNRHHLQFSIGMCCRNAAVPKPLSLFQRTLPLVPEVHHGGYVSQELAGERVVVANLSTANPVPIGVGNRQKKMANRLSKGLSPMTKKS